MSESVSATGQIQFKTMPELDKLSGWYIIRREWSCPGMITNIIEEEERVISAP